MNEINLTLVERTMLANQYRILAKLEESESYELKAEILEHGYKGKYHEVLLSDEETSHEICAETRDILQMYRVIDNSFAALTPDEQATLNMDRIAFEGFDGHESHYHYASFMIEKMDLWSEHKDRYLDSHTAASMMKYRPMLKIFRDTYGHPNYDLSRETLQRMIDAV